MNMHTFEIDSIWFFIHSKALVNFTYCARFYTEDRGKPTQKENRDDGNFELHFVVCAKCCFV